MEADRKAKGRLRWILHHFTPTTSDELRLIVYLVLHALHALASLVQGFRDSRPHAIYRAGLQTLDCGALLFAVAGTRYAHRPTPNPEINFPSARIYVLAGFLLAVVVQLDAVLRVVHALEVFIWGPEPNEPHHLLRVSFVEAAIGAVGLAMFLPPRPASASRHRRARGPKDDTPHGVFLHAAAECMDGTAIALAALATADLHSRARLAAVFSAVGAVVAARMAVPLLRSTAMTLLHAAPGELGAAVSVRLRKVALLEGVVDVYEPHFWSLAPGVHTGTMRVQIRSTADEQVILASAIEAFEDLMDDVTVQVERSDNEHPPEHTIGQTRRKASDY